MLEFGGEKHITPKMQSALCSTRTELCKMFNDYIGKRRKTTTYDEQE
jgi:hypothetical protein